MEDKRFLFNLLLVNFFFDRGVNLKNLIPLRADNSFFLFSSFSLILTCSSSFLCSEVSICLFTRRIILLSIKDWQKRRFSSDTESSGGFDSGILPLKTRRSLDSVSSSVGYGFSGVGKPSRKCREQTTTFAYKYK